MTYVLCCSALPALLAIVTRARLGGSAGDYRLMSDQSALDRALALHAGPDKPVERHLLGERYRRDQPDGWPEDGRGEIRTPETGVARLPVFKTGAFNRSATLPRDS
jgi:hypothetical protein